MVDATFGNGRRANRFVAVRRACDAVFEDDRLFRAVVTSS
jgi:hypothetical protein